MMYDLGPGWATFGLALPPNVFRYNVQVGSLPTQTDVKVRWNDGSIRHAVVTAKVGTGGGYGIQQGVPPSGMLDPVWPRLEVVFTHNTRLYTATLPARDWSGARWLNGPLVCEGQVVLTPLATDGNPHPLLQVKVDVRSYASGEHRIDLRVQNVRDVAAGAPITYDVDIYLEGNRVEHRTAVTHPWTTLWRTVIRTPGLVESTITPDLESFHLCNAIPRYLPSVIKAAPVPSGQKFNILHFGDMSPDMSSPGGRPEIAPYPNWIAQYIVHKTQTLRTYMLATANISGSWRGHITEPDGQTLISLDRYPNYWLDGRAGTRTAPQNGLVGPEPPRVYHNGGPFPGGWSEPLETAHMPSLNYIPYLLTGDRFHLEQMKYWANYTLLTSIAGRDGSKGLLVDNQPRGIGWAMRSLGDLATYIPDADPMRYYFRSKFQNNLNWLDTVAARDGGPFEFLFLQGGFVPNDRTYAPWMVNYIGWALERARQHGWVPTTALLNRIARVQNRFFNSGTEWPRTQATYYPTVGTINNTGTFTWLPTMQDIFTHSWNADPRNVGYSGQYGVDARLMLQVGARLGLGGAQGALDFLTPQITNDLVFRSGWAVQ